MKIFILDMPIQWIEHQELQEVFMGPFNVSLSMETPWMTLCQKLKILEEFQATLAHLVKMTISLKLFRIDMKIQSVWMVDNAYPI